MKPKQTKYTNEAIEQFGIVVKTKKNDKVLKILKK